MRRLVPGPTMELDVEALAEHYVHPEGVVRANMVSSLDGAVSVDGGSAPLSGDADRTVFRLLRAHCDVVLVGAGTARSERYGPPVARPEWAFLRRDRPPAPQLAVVTASGVLAPDLRLFEDEGRPPLVVTTVDAAHRHPELRRRAEVVVAGQAEVDLPAALAELRARGLSRVLCEGGPALLGTMLGRQLVDELALTVSPQVVGGPAGRIVAAASLPDSAWDLAGLAEESGVLFSRYRRRP